MKKNIFFLAISFLLLVVASSCSKESVEPDPASRLIKVTSGYALGAATKVEVYTNTAALNTGYQKFWFALYDSASGKRIGEANVRLMPMMDMGSMKHSAPYENPISSLAVNHLFEGAVFFIMSSMGGTWTLDVTVLNPENGKEGKFSTPLTVEEPVQKRMLSFTSAIDGVSKYFVSIVEPAKPGVGINNLELVVFKKASMMSFPADSSLSISFTPEMPTMNHGSPNNVQPVHSGLGHYRGKVNFTMTGLWRLYFNFNAGMSLAKTDSLDITF